MTANPSPAFDHRYCTLPCHKAYTVVANASIKAGTLLGEYIGVAHFPKTFREQYENGNASPEEQACAFDIDVDTLESIFPLGLFTGTHWQPLVIENLHAGNMARYGQVNVALGESVLLCERQVRDHVASMMV